MLPEIPKELEAQIRQAKAEDPDACYQELKLTDNTIKLHQFRRVWYRIRSSPPPAPVPEPVEPESSPDTESPEPAEPTEDV